MSEWGGLSPELLAMIADYLDLPDLMCLCLVSKYSEQNFNPFKNSHIALHYFQQKYKMTIPRLPSAGSTTSSNLSSTTSLNDKLASFYASSSSNYAKFFPNKPQRSLTDAIKTTLNAAIARCQIILSDLTLFLANPTLKSMTTLRVLLWRYLLLPSVRAEIDAIDPRLWESMHRHQLFFDDLFNKEAAGSLLFPYRPHDIKTMDWVVMLDRLKQLPEALSKDIYPILINYLDGLPIYFQHWANLLLATVHLWKVFGEKTPCLRAFGYLEKTMQLYQRETEEGDLHAVNMKQLLFLLIAPFFDKTYSNPRFDYTLVTDQPSFTYAGLILFSANKCPTYTDLRKITATLTSLTPCFLELQAFFNKNKGLNPFQQQTAVEDLIISTSSSASSTSFGL